MKHLKWVAFLLAFSSLLNACGPAAREDTAVSSAENNTEPSALNLPTSPLFTDSTPESSTTDQAEPTKETNSPTIVSAVNLVDARGIEVGFTEDGRPYRGDPAAPVLIEEFSDFQCPYCSRFHNETFPSLYENQMASGDILLVFYDFPLTSIHPQAVAAAIAARCAGEESAVAYWEMHDLLFANVELWSNDNALEVFSDFAEQIGLNLDLFDECQQAERYIDDIQADFELGQSRGISSTPSFFINDQPVIGAQPLPIFNDAIIASKNGEPITIAGQPTPQPQQPVIKPTPATIFTGDVAGQIGSPDAPVTLVEYTDYQCPFCQRHNSETMPRMLSEMIETGKVQYIIKDFPLDSIHPEARRAAAAARCAGEQGAYWEMHDAIFINQSDWAGLGDGAWDILAGLAESLELNMEEYNECAASGRYDSFIQANLQEGASLGVRGTPFFFIDGFPINGAQPYELFEYAVGLAEEGTLADAYGPPPEQAQQPPPTPSGPADIPIEGSHSIGRLDAPVVIVEYTDFQCPFCSRHYQQTMPQIKANFIDTGLVRYVFKDFPLTSIHPLAVLAAEAARCAGEQEAYPAMHNQLFTKQGEWNNRNDAATLFIQFARQLGLDSAVFTECLESHKYESAVMADQNEGIGFGVSGTPAFFLNGYFLSGAQPYSVFEEAINSLLSN